jgi:hypothetical protein
MIFAEIKSVVAQAHTKELRKFGITMGVFLLLVSAFLWWKESSAAIYAGYIAAAFILTGSALPILLKPVYIGWMSVAVVLGFFMTRVLLTLIFGLVFTPVGIFTRIARKDLIDQKYDPSADSYWIKRDRESFNRKSAAKQY